jgi:DNA (cytosine-5)-methyltransferase 1
MLSYVEHYEPNYFLLENVAGFLEHRFHNNRTTPSGGVIEIQFGMVKFVTRALIALGYVSLPPLFSSIPFNDGGI